MGYTITFSPYNSVPMVQKDYIKNQGAQFAHSRNSSFIDQLEGNDIDEPYYLPIERDDPICIQFKRGFAGVEAWNYTVLNFYDTHGNFINYFNQPTHFYTLPGDVDERGEQLHCQQFLFRPSELAYLDGHSIVTMVILCHFGDGTSIAVDDTVLEAIGFAPVLLADNHPGTSLFEFSSNTNRKNTYFRFPEIYPMFRFRVPASKMEPIPSGEYLTVDDMDNNLEVLYGNAYNKYSWEVGPYPSRMMDALNEAIHCNNLRIDESLYVWEAGGDEQEGDGPMKWRVFTLRDRNDSDTLTLDQLQVELFKRPESGYPYAITQLYLWDGFDLIFVLPYVLENSGYEATYLALCESKKLAEGATGQFIEADGTFYYKNGSGEYFSLYFPTLVKHQEMVFTLDVTNTALPANLSLFYPDSLPHDVVFTDIAGGGTGLRYTNDGNTISVFKFYDTTGTKVWRIFHSNEETRIIASSPTTYPKVTDITGFVSTRLQEFECVDANFSAHAAFNIGFLATAKRTLKALIMRKCGLNGLVADWASDLVTGTAPDQVKPFPLERFDMRQNNFSSGDVDDIIIEVEGHTAYKSGPYQFLIQGQNPAAPPTGASLAARTNITNAGVFLQHD